MNIERMIQNESVPGNACKFILVHDTGSKKGTTWENIKSFFKKSDNLSIHFLIGRGGTVVQFEEENRIAYHAGVSEWAGVKNLNNYAIGIEVFTDDGTFTAEQRTALVDLCRYLMKKWNIPHWNVLTHKSVALPLGRRSDPRPALYAEWGSGTWVDFQNKLIEVPVVVPEEKEWQQRSKEVNQALVIFNQATEALAKKKGVPFRPYKLIQ